MPILIEPGRREFLKTAGGTAVWSSVPAGASAAPQAVRGDDRPVGAVIGLGGRGRGMAEWQMPPYADVVAICDVDLRKAGPVVEALYKRTGRKVEVYQDYRRLLDRKDIHVIANTTPPHWHTRINVDACRAGKDVYAEKPMTLTIDEGKILRKVVAETGRVIQIGSQQRSGQQFYIACDLVRHGRIGKLKQIAVILPPGSYEHGGPCAEEDVPRELNWDMWQGQAPVQPFCSARLRSGSYSEYAGGLVTDWGAHHMDIAHWGMGGEEVGPLSIEAQGYCPNLGKSGYPDQFHPFSARLEYLDGIEMWFFSGFKEPNEANQAALRNVVEQVYGKIPENIRNYRAPDNEGGVLFIGSKNSIFVGRAVAVGEGVGELTGMPLPENQHMRWRACLYPHMQNFVECVGTRRKPVSNVAEQHRSQLPCHLVNIALRVGRKLRWDPKREEFVGDQEANSQLRRAQREPYQIKG
jgi:predicted dehydrogenase